eukprot:m.205654 g.205654  ORF g.205654 m.205654 type:complete len:79 (+) comp16898_c10_seq1:181-417(+)
MARTGQACAVCVHPADYVQIFAGARKADVWHLFPTVSAAYCRQTSTMTKSNSKTSPLCYGCVRARNEMYIWHATKTQA